MLMLNNIYIVTIIQLLGNKRGLKIWIVLIRVLREIDFQNHSDAGPKLDDEPDSEETIEQLPNLIIFFESVTIVDVILNIIPIILVREILQFSFLFPNMDIETTAYTNDYGARSKLISIVTQTLTWPAVLYHNLTSCPDFSLEVF
ncbi:hypothetical protein BDA99DRAFT_544243 [Phascolomyces articulosus]|uniref:Uncharacterized protein n=1 Tax=Phascolomyces articulosus TaxID=60185 RepID=A0AAD5JVK4_9FUNG|nr:hypothetical protein BDA99DRAFT_544243 [Phascolomyces articulosus]